MPGMIGDAPAPGAVLFEQRFKTPKQFGWLLSCLPRELARHEPDQVGNCAHNASARPTFLPANSAKTCFVAACIRGEPRTTAH
jgi:hypothetical protein